MKRLYLAVLPLIATALPAPAQVLFPEPALLALPENVSRVALADVTGDGRTDVVLGTSFCSGDCRLLVLPQNAFGGLEPPMRYPAPEASSLVAGDLDGDGREDVLVAGGHVELFLQRPDGRLDAGSRSPEFRNALYAEAADLDGDGRRDVVSVPIPDHAPTDLVVDIHRQQPDGGFVRRSISLAPTEYCELCAPRVADLDGDGRQDILLADDRNRLVFLYQQPDGGFVQRFLDGFQLGLHLGNPAVADLDGDPLAEIVVPAITTDPRDEPRSRFMRIDQTAARAWKMGGWLPLDVGVLQTEAGDLDGDGLDDLVLITVGSLGVNTVRIYLQDPGGPLVLSQELEIPFGNYFGPDTLAIGDLSHDGLADIAIADDNFGLITLVQQGSGEPVPAPELFSAAIPDFGFTVRISSGSSGPSLAGALEPSCIPETVCVSGAVPGRSEVFLRVVGPKPNGRLWPTLVKFTTSRVDVWVHQISTGEVRHYSLRGASPGRDELPGLFDRRGFAPSALSGSLVAEPTVEPPPPPSGEAFTSPSFPGFRFRARITSGGESLPVTAELECIEETLCFSGALPGRSELFVRIVGPKPNGHLWPTIVKFTTSQVEVWIEQVATGETRYYRIAGAAPGKDDLTGLFDRTGFEP